MTDEKKIEFDRDLNTKYVIGQCKMDGVEPTSEEIEKRVDIEEKEFILQQIFQKLVKEGSYDKEDWEYYKRRSELWLPYLPKEVYQNVYEYLNDEDISDIKYHGLSILDIMKENPHNGSMGRFYSCLKRFIEFVQDGQDRVAWYISLYNIL